MAEGEKKAHDLDMSCIKGSDEFCELHCQSCTNVGKFVPAQGFCVNCAEYFCGQCCLEHKKFNATKHHFIKNKDEMTNYNLRAEGRSPVNDCSFVDKCSSHNEEYIKFICQTCESLGCSACVATLHRKCEKVDYIPDILDQKTLDKNFREVYKDLLNLLDDIAEDGDVTAVNEETLKKYKADALRKMELERQRVNQHFDQLENRFRTETDIVENEDFGNITKATKDISCVKQEVEDAKSCLEYSEKFEAVAKFVAMKKAMTLMSTAQTRLEGARKMSAIRRYTFVPSNQVLQAIRRVDKFGSLVFTKTRLRKAIFHSDIILLDKSKLTETERSSKGCSVQGIQLLSEDKLAYSDSFNYSVKLVDIGKSELLSSLPMSSWPFGITKVRRNRLAVTLPALKQIQILRIEQQNNELAVEKELDLGKVCCGVAFHRGLLYVTFSHPQIKLEIIELSGRVLKVFSNDIKGQNLFERPFYIDISFLSGTICVSDVESNSLTYLSINGDFIKRFQDKKLIPVMRDVELDEDGVLYACAFSEDGIYQVSEEGFKTHRILSAENGIKGPQALAYCSKSNRLYVGMDAGICIKVFDIIF